MAKRLEGFKAWAFRRQAAYRRFAATDSGEVVLDDLMATCFAQRNPTVPGDAIATGVNIGMQQVGFHILARLGEGHRDIEKRARRVAAAQRGERDYDEDEAA